MRVSTDCMPSWAKNAPLRAPASPAPLSYLDLEEAPHLHGEAHVAFELELARHEGHLAIELAADHVQPVLGGHGDGQVRRGRWPRVHGAGAVLDHGVPGAAALAADLVLDGLVDPRGIGGLELGGHLVEGLFYCRPVRPLWNWG